MLVRLAAGITPCLLKGSCIAALASHWCSPGTVGQPASIQILYLWLCALT